MLSQGKALTVCLKLKGETSKKTSENGKAVLLADSGSAVSFSSCGAGNKWCIKFHLRLD